MNQNFEGKPILVNLREMLDRPEVLEGLKTDGYEIDWTAVYNLMQGLEGDMYTTDQLRAAARLLWNAVKYVRDRELGKAEGDHITGWTPLPLYQPVYISATCILTDLAFRASDLAEAKAGFASNDTADILFDEHVGE
jgi:hypothetical protein